MLHLDFGADWSREDLQLGGRHIFFLPFFLLAYCDTLLKRKTDFVACTSDVLYIYLEQGPGVLDCDDNKKGLLPRVVDGLFDSLKSSTHIASYTVKLSMVLKQLMLGFWP